MKNITVWNAECDDEMGYEAESVEEMLTIISNFPCYWTGYHYHIVNGLTGEILLTVYLRKREK